MRFFYRMTDLVLKDSVCNVIDVQRVVNAAQGGPYVSP